MCRIVSIININQDIKIWIIFHRSTALVGLGLLLGEVSRSHSDTPHSEGLLLDECSACRRDLYLTTQNTHKRKASMPPAGFELQSQQASGRRPTPYTARPLGSTYENHSETILYTVWANDIIFAVGGGIYSSNCAWNIETGGDGWWRDTIFNIAI
jgi:hypothetical protein